MAGAAAIAVSCGEGEGTGRPWTGGHDSAVPARPRKSRSRCDTRSGHRVTHQSRDRHLRCTWILGTWRKNAGEQIATSTTVGEKVEHIANRPIATNASFQP